MTPDPGPVRHGMIEGMAYSLQALIAADRYVFDEAARAIAGLTVVPLKHGFAMIPLTGRLRAALGPCSYRPYEEIFDGLTSTVAELAAGASRAGPVAYCEAEFFGGDGGQASIVWRGGAVEFGPVHVAVDDDGGCPPVGEWAINLALARLGGITWTDPDHFQVVGLNGHRATEAWVNGRAGLAGR
ncbi:hypothetical protein [Amycolatopsis sp. CA-230715]|uniref:hypothetical protein n=1 Tax=Amycolatopsis sp. CA-230715 TaxID=2745196 RepID=UPI001C035567|nr:hypothetical protein [Amycolatopsis sp. CA-230715]